MCGICGFTWEDKGLCKGMADTIRHRGPDDEGFYFDKNVSLGHRRLSIIDISLGHQPIYNEDKSMCIIFNGEIFNHLEIRAQLGGKHKFTTKSDTEAILHAYEEWGPDCVKRFNGMWAFCIYDKKRKLLFFSRDRFGIKPLYYSLCDGGLIFASEIKALLKHIKPKPNDRVVHDFLFSDNVDSGEETFFEGIKRVEPSTSMTFHLADGSVNKTVYWDIDLAEKSGSKAGKSGSGDKTTPLKEKDYVDGFRDLLKDSIALRLVAEVPVGTCLSGGLDSSSIVCLANEEISNTSHKVSDRQKTFTAVYKEKEADESEYVEEVIKRTGVEKNFTYPIGKGLFEDLNLLAYYQDEPYRSTSMYAQWEVMKLAKKKVKVLLDGQGSDELLAGYMGFLVTNLKALYAKKRFARLLKEGILSSDLLVPLALFSLHSHSDIGEFIDPNFAKRFKSLKRRYRSSGSIRQESYAQLKEEGLQELLRYEDRNSMAFSIEARVPFLDYRLVEYVFSLPDDQRIKNGWTKRILRESMKGILPDSIRLRRKKMGFQTPEAKWLRDNKEKVMDIFKSKSFGSRPYFNQRAVVSGFEKFCNGKKYKTNIFWRLISLEIWMRVFINEDRNDKKRE